MASIVLLLPLTPADRGLLEDLLGRMSPRSRQLRFLTPLPRVPRRLLDALADVDDHRHFGWLALANGRPIGHAHAVRTGEGEAEIAIMVADPYQGRGVGRLLLRELRRDAAARGIERLTVEIDPGNAAAAAFARSEGAALSVHDGLLSGALALDQARKPRIASTIRGRSLASGRWKAPSRTSRRAPGRPAVSC